MTSDSDAREEGVDDLFWRDEVLEAMYWMIGEGIEEAVAPADLRGFLDAPDDVVARIFDRLDAGGYVRETTHGYVFTEQGEREASRRFADEFEDIRGFDVSHTDCGPDCWCHDPDHAEDECPAEHDHQHA